MYIITINNDGNDDHTMYRLSAMKDYTYLFHFEEYS